MPSSWSSRPRTLIQMTEGPADTRHEGEQTVLVVAPDVHRYGTDSINDHLIEANNGVY